MARGLATIWASYQAPKATNLVKLLRDRVSDQALLLHATWPWPPETAAQARSWELSVYQLSSALWLTWALKAASLKLSVLR